MEGCQDTSRNLQSQTPTNDVERAARAVAPELIHPCDARRRPAVGDGGGDEGHTLGFEGLNVLLPVYKMK